ncbi:mdm34p [Saccharomyces arboricola H-6]|uniref:Mitochondrial distribution and morphology protein 34 n=1 Tax=Saccharomyces arboricola (strain H-6 / AS 2.3317 / CBS 10644) TaxID=1160507 RepID=J8PNX0_SACAR|nr:mdm34p [Saccharomyces arboricola H-6]
MSFRFNEDVFGDNSFNERIREKLSTALNSPSKKKLDILKSGITVQKVDFPTIPQLEILDLDIITQPRSLAKGICKISCKDAMLRIQTVIESNLLLINEQDTPSFTTPRLINNGSFTIPITMTFSAIELEAITNIFVKNPGIGISFNDVDLDFKFDCSIKILQSTIERRLKESMHVVFKDVLPSLIFNTSQNWFTSHGEGTSTIPNKRDHHHQQTTMSRNVILDGSDFQDLSPINMLRLSSIVSSRSTLSLHSTVMNSLSAIPGYLERQNLYRFISRMPSLNNYYSSPSLPQSKASNISPSQLVKPFYCSHNLLPKAVLDSSQYELPTITKIQSRLFDRSNSNDDNAKPRRRKIKCKNARSSPTPKPQVKQNVGDETPTIETVTPTPVAIPVPMPEEQSPPYLTTIVSIRDKYVIPEEISLNFDTKNEPPKKKKPFYLIGLNSQDSSNNWKLGMEDSPPPYH